MTPRAFERAMGRRPQRTNPFALPVEKEPYAKLPPGALFYYWHPERDAVEPCPKAFDRELKLIHPGLFAVRPPANVPPPCDQRWILWQRDSTVRHPICAGWKLLFLWPPMDFHPIPLDNRVFANLAIIDPRRYTSGVAYFDTIVKQLGDDKAAREAEHQQYLRDSWKDLNATHKISTAGRGNRFALHHDGTILPSRGEQNWQRENEHRMLSSALQRSRREQGLGRSKR